MGLELDHMFRSASDKDSKNTWLQMSRKEPPGWSALAGLPFLVFTTASFYHGEIEPAPAIANTSVYAREAKSNLSSSKGFPPQCISIQSVLVGRFILGF